MLNTTPRKTGRPAAFYRSRRGDRIEGLSRLGDGRWRASGPQRFTFTEPDEDLAVLRYRRWQAAQSGAEVNLPVDTAGLDAAAATDKATRTSMLVRFAPGKPPQTFRAVDEDEFWSAVRREILSRPKYAAERTGIEQIAYLSDLRKPEPLPTFSDLTRTWEAHFNASAEQKTKCARAWRDFVDTAKLESLSDISPKSVIAFRDAVYARNWTGKSQSNLFNRIRRYLSFFQSRAIAVETMGRLLEHLKLLSPDRTTISTNPQPISRQDWQKLLGAAEGSDKAMILLMLNGGFYLSEVVRLKWTDIKDGCIITHRHKTGRCVRVCVLWKRTLTALRKVKRKGEYIFYTYAGRPLGTKGGEKRWGRLRERAKSTATSSQLRDGAYTACVEANVTANLCQLLMGHRSGISDHYVKRKPTMVAAACRAIEDAYFG